MRVNYKQIVGRFRRLRILVVGDVILDHYIWGVVERISPEAPVPVVDVKGENYSLGGVANVAANIVVLGANVTIAGIIGDDYHGNLLLSILRNDGIDTSGILKGNRPTTVKTRVVAHNQQVVRFDREERKKINDRILKKLQEFMLSNRESWDGIIVSDYKKGVVTQGFMNFLRREFRGRECFVAVDPKVGHFHLYKGVSIVTPNLKEASEGSGIEIRDERTLSKAGGSLLKRLGCEAVLITRGEEGMSLFEDSSVTHIPTVAKSVYDVTGAGDTVISALTLSRLAGAELKDSAVIANHAAGIVVGQIGTATATPEQIIQSFRENTVDI
ncbi:MAG TPA: D-glycero-beta-D-manno-heptose-7-phosphate kinase [Nitrospirae bacterium]|nr:bifunctional protein HldE [bacterium BMS3Abin08]HDO36901.1 D-glycero-beta-D-manno-heptose-7-phosphate kinase [Nitrospirota bacterium]HDY70929.1 D-glycero-beta-D-manno-heptose-7-phosphate kinase [Nitrospirota bacterium]